MVRSNGTGLISERPRSMQICFLLALVLIATLCSPAAASRDVRVALTDLKPTLFTDDQGKPAGFFVDLINEIAVQEDWNIIWVRGTLSESWARLSSGEIDLLPGVASTPERQVSYDFSNESALAVWSQVYARPGSGINTILDLDGKRVASVKGAMSGIAFRDYAKRFNVNITLIDKDTPAAMFSATANGEADALVVYNTAAQEDAKTYGLASTPVMFNPTQFGFAVQKGKNQELLAVVDEYIARGKSSPSSTYSQAMQKWFGIKAGSVIPTWLFWSLGGAAAVAGIFVGMSLILRRQVRKKTAELRQQNEELQNEVASRKRAENKLADEMSRRQILVDQSRDGIVIVDEEGAVYESNRRFAEMLGYSREEMEALHVWDWDAQFSRSQLLEIIRRIDATGDFFESRHRRKDGSLYDAEISSNAASFSGEKLIFCVVRDTSERKKAEEELRAAYEQLTAAGEQLKNQYLELNKSEKALMQARKKLNLLNNLTLQDIQNSLFSIAGYIELAKMAGPGETEFAHIGRIQAILHSVDGSLKFARTYQDLGLRQPAWQNVNLTLITAISHLDLSRFSRIVELEGLEIFADPMLETAFFNIMKNVTEYARGADTVTVRYRQTQDSVIIIIADNGPGIPDREKEDIFDREYGKKGGFGLFLAREILSVTGITIRENGVAGSGAQFEITVPGGEYRFRKPEGERQS